MHRTPWARPSLRSLVRPSPVAYNPYLLGRPTLGSGRRSAGLREDDVIALFLLSERALAVAGRPGPRAVHLACLPDSYESTLFWSDQELQELRGSNLLLLSQALQAQSAADFAELEARARPPARGRAPSLPGRAAANRSDSQAAIIRPNPEAFPPPHCGLEAYRWALGTLMSRAMDFPVATDAPSTSLRCIVPWADMFNAEPDAGACHAYEASRRCVIATSGREYKAGEQVCISYGKVDSASCLRLYGFVPGNLAGEGVAADCVQLYAEMAPQADGFAPKSRLLAAAGIQPGVAHTLTLEQPLPLPLLLSVRCQRLSAAGAAAQERLGRAGALLRGEAVSLANERVALGALAGGLAAMLGGYETSQEEDAALLQAAQQLPPRRVAAVALRRREKRILAAALAAAEAALEGLRPGMGGILEEQDEADGGEQGEAGAEGAAQAEGGGATAVAAAAAALAEYFEALGAEGGEGAGTGRELLDNID